LNEFMDTASISSCDKLFHLFMKLETKLQVICN